MRFGILFVGYIFLFVCKGVDIFPDFIAYLIMFAAMLNLYRFNKYFNIAKYLLIPTIIIAVINYILHIFKLDLGNVNTIVNFINNILFIVYHYYLYMGVKNLALEVNIPGIAKAALRNLYIGIVYTIFTLLVQFDIPVLKEYAFYIGPIFLLTGLIWIILTAVMIFRCYMWICLEGDEDMPLNNIKNRIKKE